MLSERTYTELLSQEVVAIKIEEISQLKTLTVSSKSAKVNGDKCSLTDLVLNIALIFSSHAKRSSQCCP